MTDAEQVACDALRMAGLGEVADNLEFAREAVRLRADLVEMLECDTEGYCAACGVHAESEAHRLSCRLVLLFATRAGWAAEEMERAHGEALRQERLRARPAPLRRIDPASLEAGVTYAVVSPHVLAAYNREYRPVASPLVGRLQLEWDAIRDAHAVIPDKRPK